MSNTFKAKAGFLSTMFSVLEAVNKLPEIIFCSDVSYFVEIYHQSIEAYLYCSLIVLFKNCQSN